ncbi:MAG TPA: C-type lectin domain-containing protein, partial [Kofleriaceae bacterium]
MRWALVAGLAACSFRPSAEGQSDAQASSGDEGGATQMDAPATPFSPACSALAGYTAHGTHAYKRTSDQPKFDDAIEECQRDGAYLVRIEDATERQYIASTYGEVWVGASDQETEGTFRNVSSNNQIITYDNFTGSEPNDNNNDEDCVYMHSDGTWNDTPCGDSHKALCECDPDYHAPAVPNCRSLSGSKTFESRMYFVHTTPATWSDAHDQCAAVGAYLMVPSDDTENSIIQ